MLAKDLKPGMFLDLRYKLENSDNKILKDDEDSVTLNTSNHDYSEIVDVMESSVVGTIIVKWRFWTRGRRGTLNRCLEQSDHVIRRRVMDIDEVAMLLLASQGEGASGNIE